ncbi:MAG TPA: hypothetical protein VGS10_08435 [Terracidiphilus sp.]|nr:hypothetical protein [Terracidiphilus sp.]
MRRIDFHNLLLCGSAMALLAGCSQPMTPNEATTPGSSPTGNLPPSSSDPVYSVGVSLSRPSVIVGTNGWGPTEVYHATDSGSAAPYASLEGCFPAMDGQGNVYMLAFYFPWGCGYFPSNIEVYSPDAVGGAGIRSLPVGPGTKITNVIDMAVSLSGEIFVNDGSGVAVFSATANGSDAPVRYIQWNGGAQSQATPGYIAVDGNDNLYVQNGGSIAVFGPNVTGLVVPSRVISGPHTQLAGLSRMTTDIQGNLYVTTGGDAFGKAGVLEFAADADGDAMPLRSISSKMSNFDGFLGVAVDSSGLIYIRTTDPYCGAVFVFAADASGNTTPLRIIGGSCPGGDIDGTIAVF